MNKYSKFYSKTEIKLTAITGPLTEIPIVFFLTLANPAGQNQNNNQC
jgi:hypothetical protein